MGGESESDYFDNTTTTRRRTLAKTTKRYIHRRRHRHSSWELNSWNLSNPSAVYCQKSKSLKEKSNFAKKCYGQPSHFSFSWFAAKFHSLASRVPTLPIL